MAHSTRNHDRTTPTQEPPARRGIASAERQAGDHVEPPTHLALAGRGPHPPFPDYPWGTQDPFGRLSQMGRAQVEQAETPRVQAGALEQPDARSGGRHRSRISLALHPLARGRMERQHRQRLLRRLANDLRLGRRHSTRPVEPVRADGASGEPVPGESFLGVVALAAVAKHLSTLRGLSVKR